jgi:release factor glutamine methyltransferase
MSHQPHRPASPRPTEAEMTLLLRAAGCVFAEDEARLLAASGATDHALLEMMDRRLAGVPLEHVLGWVDFCGLRLLVGPGVFVPRQRSALLVLAAADLTATGATVLDLCCGCGALAAGLARLVPSLRLHATDISRSAVDLARQNLAPYGARCYEGDLFTPLPAGLRGRVDTLLCNAPYVPTGEVRNLPPEARIHEPLATLDGGGDGLEVQRRVLREAREWLAPGGHLLMEIGQDQEAACLDLLAAGGLRAWTRTDDDAGAIIAIAQAPPGS